MYIGVYEDVSWWGHGHSQSHRQESSTTPAFLPSCSSWPAGCSRKAASCWAWGIWRAERSILVGVPLHPARMAAARRRLLNQAGSPALESSLAPAFAVAAASAAALLGPRRRHPRLPWQPPLCRALAALPSCRQASATARRQSSGAPCWIACLPPFAPASAVCY
eukprot:jgi/Chlat1/1588/Chrsp124S08670